MRKSLLSIVAIFACVSFSFAQEQKTSGKTNASNNTSISKQDKTISLDSGTEIFGELQNSLDVRKAKVGDKVVLKTTKEIKENGKKVLAKGTRLIGHVADVQQKTKSTAASSVNIVFDKIENGSLTAPLNATITSITSAKSSSSLNNDSIMSDTSLGSTSSARTSGSSSGSGSGGGLLGGVTNTVGGVVNTTTNTVGGVVNTTTDTLGNTTRTVGSTVNNIQISQSSSTSANGSSTLRLDGGNLKLEKGVVFQLSLTEAVMIGKKKE